MASNMLSTNGNVQYQINEYVIDKEEDLKNLPLNCAMGSTALCIATSDVYIKDSAGKWVKL